MVAHTDHRWFQQSSRGSVINGDIYSDVFVWADEVSSSGTKGVCIQLIAILFTDLVYFFCGECISKNLPALFCVLLIVMEDFIMINRQQHYKYLHDRL